MNGKKRLFFALLAAAASLFPAWGLDLAYVSPRLGVIFIMNTTEDSAATPILNTFGSSLTFEFEGDRRWSLDPGMDVYWTQYEWSETLDRAVPTEPETLASAFVPALILDLPICYRFSFGERFSIKSGLGTAFAVRLAFPGSDSIPDEEVGKIGGWFWGSGRFWYPELLVFADYLLHDHLAFEFGLRSFWPLFNLWTAEDFFDQFALQVALSMRIALR